jgi:hypothetical protein
LIGVPLGHSLGVGLLPLSLELGGAPRSHKNFWPEPWSQAHKSDPRGNAWHKKVCNGSLTLRQAQKAELAYKRKYG